MALTDLDVRLCVTVICQDNDVDTAVKVELLEAIHELTDDLIYTLDHFEHLQENRQKQRKHKC